MVEVRHLTAFSSDPAGGNRAGVVLEAGDLSDEQMQQIATEVGYSESAFIVGGEAGNYTIRYFSPLAEVPFCGHATIATAVALAERDGEGRLLLTTNEGPVPVLTRRDADGRMVATLTSVPPQVSALEEGDLEALLDVLRWAKEDLDPDLPPKVAYAGGWHPILAVATRERLRSLDYDFEAAATLMAARGWTTLQLVWRQDVARFHARNPFPPGGVVEDAATGAAAAALGAYLREQQAVTPPATFTIQQGDDMGRPSVLTVDVLAGRPEIDVTGTAVAIG